MVVARELLGRQTKEMSENYVDHTLKIYIHPYFGPLVGIN
jgi:hypothetical protein